MWLWVADSSDALLSERKKFGCGTRDSQPDPVSEIPQLSVEVWSGSAFNLCGFRSV
jgi:hypothetical protein